MRAVTVVILISFLLETLAQNCVINVSESSVKRLYNPIQSDVPCQTLWNNLVNHFGHTQHNLTVGQERELTRASEPSVSNCQRMLETAKLEMQGDHNYYTNTMQKKIQLNEWNAKKYQEEQATLQQRTVLLGKDFKSFYRNLIFLNIGAGSSKLAIKYYHRYLEGHPPGPLLNDLVDSVYRDPAYENERFEHLLDFVRKLAGSSLKLSLYKLIHPAMMKHPMQRDSYRAMLLALDVGRIAFANEKNIDGRRLYLNIFQPALAYLKRAVETANYDEIVTFATKYPNHFEEIENRLSTLETDVWNRANFSQFVTYPNRLPLGKQRLEAFRMPLLQINKRNKHDFTKRLVIVAKELEQCEMFIKSGKNEPRDQDKLITVKGLFAKLDPSKDYEHYLKEAKKQ
uniref:Uncharacterized protein n=2 Tax=Anopheles funestus TaxID=62324 RepID=A0A182R483_ANOFN